MMDWVGLKGWAADMTVAKDALHVYLGVAIQIGAAALLRRPLSHWAPWLVVLAAAFVNVVLDFYFGEEATLQPWQIDGARHDIVNTMVLPTLLLLLCRFAPRLFVKGRRR